MIDVTFNGELRSVGLREFKKRDGSNGYSYPMLVECGADSYQFDSTVDMYNAFVKGELKKGLNYDFKAEFEPRFQYNNFKIVAAECTDV